MKSYTGPHPTTDTRQAEHRRLARNIRVSQMISMAFLLAWVGLTIWSGMQISLLKDEVRGLDEALEQCLEVVGGEVGPGYL